MRDPTPENRPPMLKEARQESQDRANQDAFPFLMGFVKTLRYTATKVFYSGQYTPYHLYIDDGC